MTTEDLYTKSYLNFTVKTSLLKEFQTIVYEMEGFLSKNHVDAYVNDLIELARTHQPKAMIADPRKMATLSNEVQEVIQKKFWPEIAKLNVICNPAIVPESFLTSSSVDRMIEGATQDLELGQYTLKIATFTSMDDCLNWITRETA